jgi:tyrosinase
MIIRRFATSRRVAAVVICVVGSGLLGLAPTGRPAEAQADVVRVRKDVKALTAQERRDFVRAVLKLKRVPSPYRPGLSYYDQFVDWHVRLNGCNPGDPLLRDVQLGHGGPVFLPWHREFVLLFENALREVSGKDISVPYWDWTDPASTRAVFSDGFMGGDGDPADGYAVNTGPFRKGRWQLNVQPTGIQWSPSATPYITRHFGGWPNSPLPKPKDVQFALDASRYDAPPYSTESNPAESFRNAVDGFRPPLSSVIACGPDGVVAGGVNPAKRVELHNAVHLWTGGMIAPDGGGTRLFGTMANVSSSPNDPVFFLHHVMVDRIWAEWQERHGADTYEPRAGVAHNSVDQLMEPYATDGLRVRPRDVADIRELGYRYDSRSLAAAGPRRPASGGQSLAAAVGFFCSLPGHEPSQPLTGRGV